MRSRVASAVVVLCTAVVATACTTTSSATPTAKATAMPSPSPGGASARPSGPPLSTRDSDFLSLATSNDKFEIDAGRLAEHRAADSRIRQFGSRMVTDHGQDYQRAQALGKAHGMAVATGPTSDQSRILTIWSSQHGGAFDCSYAPTQYTGHLAVVMAYMDEAAHADSPQVREFASGQLPMVQSHLSTAAQNLTGLKCSAR